jgi:hypothetical protein
MNSLDKFDQVVSRVQNLIDTQAISCVYLRTNVAERIEEDQYPCFTVNMLKTETVRSAAVDGELDTVFDLFVTHFLEDYQDKDEVIDKTRIIYGDIKIINDAILDFGEIITDKERSMTVDNGQFAIHYSWAIKF